MKLLKILDQELKIKMSPSFGQKAACPLALKYGYVDRVGDKFVRVAAERGSAAHEAISELIDVCLESEIQPKDLTKDRIGEAVLKHTPYCVVSDIGLILSWVLLWAERWIISKDHYGHEEKVGLDDVFDECDFHDASYRGVIDDLIIKETHATITDWKSQPHILSQTELDDPLGDGAPWQLTMYCWLVSKLYPYLETFTVRIWYLRYGFYQETTRSQEDLDRFEYALMLQEKKISEIENWDPIPGKHCQYCDYIHMCPLASNLDDDNPEVISQEQAVKAASQITVMESRTKDLKAKLKHYINNNDNVRVGDKWEYGFNKKQSSEWDPVQVEELLTEHGMHLSEIGNIDKKKIQKLIKTAAKEGSALAVDLESLAKTKYSTRFEGYQPAEK